MELEETRRALAQFGQPNREGNTLGFIPTPSERVERAAAGERALLASRYQGLGQEAQNYANVRQARDENPIYDIAGDSDTARAVLGGLDRGLGTALEGAGYLSRQVIDNPISRGLESVGKALTQSGQGALDSRSQRTQYAIQDTRMTGNVLTGENFSMGTDPSVLGLFHQILPAIAEMAPQIASLFVGGAAGAALSVGTGVAQAGISQGNEQFELIMGKNEREMSQFSTAYNQLKQQNPNMSHEEAQREIADSGKAIAAMTGGAIGGAGGALTRWLWAGAPLVGKGTTAAGTAALRAAAEPARKKLADGVLARAATGFIEEGAEEVAETVGARAAVNAAVGSEQELGKDTLGDFVLGGITGATINTAGAVRGAASDVAKKRSEAAATRAATTAATQAAENAQTADTSIEINERIDAGKIEEVLKDTGTKYTPDLVTATLIERAQNKDATPEQRKEADEALATLDVKSRESLAIQEAIKEQGVESYYAAQVIAIQSEVQGLEGLFDRIPSEKHAALNRSIKASKAQLTELESAVAAQTAVTPEERDEKIKVLKSTISKIEAGSQATRQAVRDSTPDNTPELVNAVNDTTRTPEERTQIAEEVIDRAIVNPDQVSDTQLQEMVSGDIPLNEDTKQAAQMTLDLRVAAATSDTLQAIKTNPEKLDKKYGYVAMDEYYARVERALSARNPGAATRIIGSVEKYERFKRSKAEAVSKAYKDSLNVDNRKIQYRVYPVVDETTKETRWVSEEVSVAGRKFAEINAAFKGDKPLMIHKGSTQLVEETAKEADFIATHAKVLAYQVKRSDSKAKPPASTTSTSTASTGNTPPPDIDTGTESKTTVAQMEGWLTDPKLDLTPKRTHEIKTAIAQAKGEPAPPPFEEPPKERKAASAPKPVTVERATQQLQERLNVLATEEAQETPDQVRLDRYAGHVATAKERLAAAAKEAGVAVPELTGAVSDQVKQRTKPETKPKAKPATPAATVASTDPVQKALEALETQQEILAREQAAETPDAIRLERYKANVVAAETRLAEARTAAGSIKPLDPDENPFNEPGEGTNSDSIDTSTLTDEERAILNEKGIRGVKAFRANKGQTPPKQQSKPETPPAAPDLQQMSNTELLIEMDRVYEAMGALQDARMSGDSVSDADMFAARKEVDTVAKYAFKAAEQAPMLKLVGLLNKPEGAPIRDVANWAYQNSQDDLSVLLKMLKNTDAYGSTVNVTLGTLLDRNKTYDEGFTGAYDSINRQMVLRPKPLPGYSAPALRERFAETVTHELIHPVANKAMTEDPAFKAEVARVVDAAREWYGEPANKARVEALGVTRHFEYAIAYKDGELSPYERYGDADFPLEILSTVMGNAAVRQAFSLIADPTNADRNILQALRDAIIDQLKKLLNNPDFDQTLLEAVVGLTDTAITRDTPKTGKPNGTNNTPPSSDTSGTDNSTDTDTGDSATGTPTPETRADESAEQEANRLRREATEEAIKKGEETLYGFETDGDVEAGHEGPIREADAETANLVRAHQPSRHRTPMSYSPHFLRDVFLNPEYKLNDFARYLTNPKKTIERFRAKGKPGQYRRVLNKYHTKWVEDLQRTVQEPTAKYRIQDMIGNFFQDGVLDENAASAIAMAAFSHLSENGNSIYTNHSEKMRRRALAVDDQVDIPPEMDRLALTIGMRKETIEQAIGRTAAQLMDLTMPETTPENEQVLLYGSLGSHALILLMRDKFYERNVYNGLQVNPENYALLQQLKSTNQEPSEAVLKDRTKLKAHLKGTDLSLDQQAQLHQAAFATHVFIRSNRSVQKDVSPLMRKLRDEGLLGDRKMTQAGIDKMADQSITLTPDEKVRVKDVYRSWYRKKSKKEQSPRLLPPPQTSEVMDAVRGSRGFMDELLGRKSNQILPHTDPAKAGFSGTTKHNSDIPLPQAVIDVLDTASKVPRGITQGLLSTQEGALGILTRMNQADPDFLPYIQGMLNEGEDWRHADDAVSIDAKAEALRREQRLLVEHIYDVQGGDSLTPFFKNYNVQSNERITEDSAGFNAQALKMHRAMETHADWFFDVDPTADVTDTSLLAFKHAVAQSMGIGVDKMSPVEAVKEFDNLRQTAVAKEAVAIMNLMRTDPDYVWSAAEQRRLIVLVNSKVKPGDGAQYLRGLLELARYEDALLTGQSFTTDISAEIDGRASGATITMMQMGMTSVDWEEHMLLGGMIPMSSVFTNAGDAIQETQNDIYKTVVRTAVENMDKHGEFLLKQGTETPSLMWRYDSHVARRKLVHAVLGSLSNTDQDSDLFGLVSSVARQVVKEPTTANVFGAGEAMLQNTMSAEFYELFKAKVVKFASDYEQAKDDAARAEIEKEAWALMDLANKVMPPKMPKFTKKPEADYTSVIPSRAQKERLTDAVTYTLASATTISINHHFKETRALGKQMQRGLGMVQELYKTMYEAEKAIVLNEQLAKAEEDGRPIYRPTFKFGGKHDVDTIYQPDVTRKQRQATEEKLRMVMPMFHSPSSLAEMNPAMGMPAFKAGVRPVEERDMLTGEDGKLREVKFTGLQGHVKLTEPMTPFSSVGAPINVKSTSFKGHQVDHHVVGIGGQAKGAHSQDAAVARNLLAYFGLINAFDGFTAGGALTGEMGQMANKEFLYTLAGYSQAEQVARMVLQSVDAFNALRGRYAGDETFERGMYKAIPTEWNPETSQWETIPDSPIEVAFDLMNAAADASRTKFLALAETKVVDQYYHFGSAYPVSDSERADFALKAELSDVVRDLSAMRDSELAEPFPTDTAVRGEAQKRWLDIANARVNPDAVPKVRSYTAENPTAPKDFVAPALAEPTEEAKKAAVKARPVTFGLLKTININIGKLAGTSEAEIIKLSVQDLVAHISSDNQRNFVQSILVDPGSKIVKLIPGKQLKAFRAWHKHYHRKGSLGSKSEADDDLQMMPAPSAGPLDYSTQAVFDALNKNQMPSDEAQHLKQLLSSITDKVFDNSKGSPGLTRAEMGQSVDDLAAARTLNNIGPFSSNLQQAGVTLSRAQAFVAEQIEQTLQEALSSQTLADNSIVAIYNQAKAAFNTDGREFYLDPQGRKASAAEWGRATDQEKAQAKQAYDLIFTPSRNRAGSRSDHLSRFVALGLVYPPLRNELNALQSPDTTPAADEKLGARLERYFNELLQRISNLLNGVNRSTQPVASLEQLAKRLAIHEHQRRMALNTERMKSVEFVDKALQQLSNKAKDSVVDIATSKMVADSKKEIVKAIGNITTIVAEDRVDAVLAVMEQWKDSERKGVRESLIRSGISEIRGENPENRIFYKLLGWAKVIEQGRKEKKDVIHNEILSRFENFDTITDNEKAAITQLYLRSDLASLMAQGLSMERIHQLVLNQDTRRARIEQLQDKLLGQGAPGAALTDITEMAYEMATGRGVSEFGFQNSEIILKEHAMSSALLNATNELGSLLALDMAPRKHHVAAQALIERESARGAQDALRYVVGMHRSILVQSREALFDGNALTTIKGYLRESYDPYNTYEVADSARGTELLAMGYTLYGPVNNSSLAASNTLGRSLPGNATGKINKAQKVMPNLYILKDQGMADYQTAAMMNNQMTSRGSLDNTTFDYATTKGVRTGSRETTARMMAAQKRKRKAARVAKLDPKTYRPSVTQEIHEMPVFDAKGAVTGFRYKATHQTRDEAMGRDNRVEAVLGMTAGSSYGKEHSVAQNKKVVNVLKEFYDANLIGNENRYVEISPAAPDPRMRETYQMLPDHTKEEIRKVWGGNKMMIRKDLVDVTLGYRNLTTDVVINKTKRKIDQMTGRAVVGQALGPKRAIQVRRFHDHVVEIMRKYKSFVVVRNFTTLYDNVKSNAMLLYMYGVPLKDLVTGHRRAFQGLKSYQRDQKAMLRLQAGIDAAPPGTDTSVQELQVAELQFALDRNPVKPLIDEGLFQTILDDVDLDRENSVFKNASEKFVDRQVAKLPKIVANAGKQLFVAEDTWTYKMLSQSTQQSDFIARFVLYENMKKKQTQGSGESDEDIMSEVRQAFVNYNRPTDQRLQYLNDIGLLRFTKYFLGTQKIIFNRIKKAPSRAMVAFMADRYVDNLDTVLGSNMLTNVGNPLHSSVLDAPSVLDEPIYIKLGLGLL